MGSSRRADHGEEESEVDLVVGGVERGGVGTGGDEDVVGSREERGGRGLRVDGAGDLGREERVDSGGVERVERDVVGTGVSTGDADVDVGMARGGDEVSWLPLGLGAGSGADAVRRCAGGNRNAASGEAGAGAAPAAAAPAPAAPAADKKW